MSDAGERTEKATPRHLREVQRSGKLGRSQDLPAWLGIAAAAVMLPTVIGAGSSAAVSQFYSALAIASQSVHDGTGGPTASDAMRALGAGLGSILGTIAPILIAVVIAVIAGSVLQGGFRVQLPRLTFDHFNVPAGLARKFTLQALWQGVRSLLKAGAVGIVLYLIVMSLMPTLLSAGTHTIPQMIASATTAISWMLAASIAAGLAIAALDVVVVMRRNRNLTMMTKRQLRDENRSNEGDPLVRQHRRSRQLAVSRSRMIQAVGESSVVLVNPTTYAVALRYEPGKSAPRVVAKGKDNIAARIRDEAEAKKVPMVRDIALTRAIHASVPLGGEIPPELYTVVAQVLTFVALLKRRGAADGVHELPGVPGGAPDYDNLSRTSRASKKGQRR